MQYSDVFPDLNNYWFDSCWDSYNAQQNNVADNSSQTELPAKTLVTSAATSPIQELADNGFIEWNKKITSFSKKIQAGEIQINSATSPISFIKTNTNSTDTNDLPNDKLIQTSSHTQTKPDLLLHSLKLWQPFATCKNILLNKGLSSLVCFAISDNQYVNLGSNDSFEDD